VPIPKGVDVKLDRDILTVKGPKGELKQKIHPKVKIDIGLDEVKVTVDESTKSVRALHGLYRVLVNNMVTGVTKGFEKSLEIVGVGYRVELSGRTATFHLGYSHPIEFPLPDGVEAKVERTKITLSAIDKELLGHTAAKIRRLRPPEPYKGKGIRYENEMIKRKAGKTGAK